MKRVILCYFVNVLFISLLAQLHVKNYSTVLRTQLETQMKKTKLFRFLSSLPVIDGMGLILFSCFEIKACRGQFTSISSLCKNDKFVENDKLDLF